MSRVQRDVALRRDPVDRPGGPGGPGTAQPDRAARRCGVPLASIPLELGDWVGAGRAGRPRHRRAMRRPPNTSTGPTRAASSPGCSFASGSTTRSRATNLRHTPGDLPAVRGLDQDRVADARARRTRRTRAGRSRSPGWVISEVNWSSMSDSGTTFSVKGSLENYVRRFPITSRSSHGRTTRGSSMTVEVFYPGDNDPEGEALREFARELVKALEPILPLEPRRLSCSMTGRTCTMHREQTP